MSDVARRPQSGLSRKTREQRAYRLILAGGAAATVAVVSFVLALIGVVGLGMPVLAAIVAGICWLLFRRTVGP